MIALIAALALAAADPPADVQPPQDPAADLADMRKVWDDSCAAREFGAYDDLCLQLQRQIRRAEAEQAREARRQPKPQAPSRPASAAPAANGASLPPPPG